MRHPANGRSQDDGERAWAVVEGGGKMTNPPTPRQIEAYRLCNIHQCTHEEAGKLMGCSRSNVTRLLIRLVKSRPDLKTNRRPTYVTLEKLHNSLPCSK